MYCQIWRLYLFNILIQYLFLFVSSSVLPRVGNLFFGFSNESLVFSERNSDSLFSKSELSPSLFFKEQRELKCHFLKKSDWAKSSSSDSLFGIKRGMKNIRKIRIRIENNLLPVALLKRIMRVIHSRLLFFKERREQFPHGHSFLKSDESKSLTFAL